MVCWQLQLLFFTFCILLPNLRRQKNANTIQSGRFNPYIAGCIYQCGFAFNKLQFRKRSQRSLDAKEENSRATLNQKNPN